MAATLTIIPGNSVVMLLDFCNFTSLKAVIMFGRKMGSGNADPSTSLGYTLNLSLCKTLCCLFKCLFVSFLPFALPFSFSGLLQETVISASSISCSINLGFYS